MFNSAIAGKFAQIRDQNLSQRGGISADSSNLIDWK